MKRAGKKKDNRLQEAVIQELAAIGLSRVTEVLTMDNDKLCLQAALDTDPQKGAAIAGVERTAGGWKIKFYDKLKALELLGEYFGLFGGAGKPVPEGNNLLEAILNSTKEDFSTSDIQELQQAADSGDDMVE